MLMEDILVFDKIQFPFETINLNQIHKHESTTMEEKENDITEKDEIFYPDNDYWELVGKKKVPSEKAKENYKNFANTPFIDKKCAREIRGVKHCNMCLHYFECLEKGKSINSK